jgi:BRCA1-associated protein
MRRAATATAPSPNSEEFQSSAYEMRSVITGNPSLGTHGGGFVHIYRDNENAHDDENNADIGSECDDVDVEEQEYAYNRMVAICNVPPEQVPEGVLNLARSYLPFIRHIRVLIANNENGDDGDHNDSVSDDGSENDGINIDSFSVGDKVANNEKESPFSSSFAQDAAAILDDESQKNIGAGSNAGSISRKYMILILVSSSQVASSIVQNLHHKPFTNFELGVVASVYHVSKLEGEVSLHSTPSSLTQTPNHHQQSMQGQGSSPNRHRKRSTSSTLSDANGNGSINTSSKSNGTNAHSTGTAKQAPPQKPNASILTNTKFEVNNCPVCLEAMELGSFEECIPANPPSLPITNPPNSNANENPNLPATFTTVCNHTFHLHCLLQWEDAPCPVCRFDHAGINDTLSQCHVCGSTQNVYVCLICGVASCSNNSHARGNRGNGEKQLFRDGSGRGTRTGSIDAGEPPHSDKELNSCNSCDTLSAAGHAREHYDETLHAYAVNTETQHVWDFVGQGYVHRLIQNADDGKIVEVADPSNTTSQERSLIPSLTDAEEGAVVHRKLEGYANQYYNLLQNQLGQQRMYFEGILREIRHDHETNANKSKETARSPSALISALKQELNQLQQRHHTLEKKSNKVAENITFLKNMNESLEANKEPMKREIHELQKARVDYGDMLKRHLPLLEDRVRLLMIKLENET